MFVLTVDDDSGDMFLTIQENIGDCIAFIMEEYAVRNADDTGDLEPVFECAGPFFYPLYGHEHRLENLRTTLYYTRHRDLLFSAWEVNN